MSNADLIAALRRDEWHEAADALEAAEARIKELERLDREAASHVESVICMRSGHFTGDPPYVGWRGLGLALSQDYDDLRAAEVEVARLREALEAGVTMRQAQANYFRARSKDDLIASKTAEAAFDKAARAALEKKP